MFTFIFLLSFVLLIAYDLIGRDIFGIIEIKAKARLAMDRLSRRFRFVHTRTKRSVSAWILEFMFFYWQFLPFLAQPLIRPAGKRASIPKELTWLLLGTAYFTAIWTVVALAVNGVIKVAAPFLRHLIGLG